MREARITNVVLHITSVRRRRYEETTIIAWTDEYQNHVDMGLYKFQIGLQEAAVAAAVGRPSV